MFERRLLPVITLLLVALLTLVTGLWATDRAQTITSGVGVEGADRSNQQFEWKLVTTWPKN